MALLRQFPEDHLDVDQRIFGDRFLTPRWRHFVGEEHGPYDAKESRVVKWIEQYLDYISDLERCTAIVMGKPDLFATLPLKGPAKVCAVEYIRALDLQRAVLRRIQSEEARVRGETGDDRISILRAEVRAAVKASGVDEIAFKTGLSRDTINDFLNGRVKKPHRATVQKLEKYLNEL